MTLDLFLRLTGLFCGLFVIGTALCLPLFGFKPQKLLASSLWTKIRWWIPIYAVFIAILFLGTPLAVGVAILITVLAIREFQQNQGTSRLISILYMGVFCIAIAHLGLFFEFTNQAAAVGLIVVCFASALSDVSAFFAGNYLGHWSLPRWINPNKSWEGVIGQIVGALIGYGLLVATIDISGYWMLALGIGAASAVGDLINSTAKRSLNIKDWGQTIPGHGGVLDRFSSLSLAIAWSFWILW